MKNLRRRKTMKIVCCGKIQKSILKTKHIINGNNKDKRDRVCGDS